MRETPLRLLTLSLLLIPTLARADVYALGSSFTWDAIPDGLDQAPEWHIECGKSLVYIFEHPWEPCGPTSSLWPPAFWNQSFDAISFQPVNHAGSRLWDDLLSIHTWLGVQTTAAIVIHQSWPPPGNWEGVFHGELDPDVTNRSLAYGYTLLRWLQVIFPERSVALTRSNEMLDRIYHDCLAGRCPLPNGFDDLFRDGSGHMSRGPGSYLQHNALRAAFGQPTGVEPPRLTIELSPEVRAYLDDVVVQYAPEPGADLALAAGAALLGALARRRSSRGVASSA
jgi:hypothetical protein